MLKDVYIHCEQDVRMLLGVDKWHKFTFKENDTIGGVVMEVEEFFDVAMKCIQLEHYSLGRQTNHDVRLVSFWYDEVYLELCLEMLRMQLQCV